MSQQSQVSPRSGYAGILYETAAVLDRIGAPVPRDGSLASALIRYEGISMPAFICANADGAGPGIIRPWVGAERGEVLTSITADLSLGIRDLGGNGQVASLGIRNFHIKSASGAPGRKVTIGRPVSMHNDFGASGARHEAYTSITARARIFGGQSVCNDVRVEDIDGVESELFMEKSGLPLFKQPTYLLGSTCLLAAARTSRPAVILDA